VRGGDACEESFVATDADADAARGGCFKHRGAQMAGGSWVHQHYPIRGLFSPCLDTDIINASIC
jgi:hypothetical protein